MRTTLDIDVAVLTAAKEIARREGKTAGAVLSELARRALTLGPPGNQSQEPEASYGFRPFAPRGAVVTADAIDKLRDEDGV